MGVCIMKATDIFTNLNDSYIYMERYVNEGSPSGFTSIHTTSYETNPFTGLANFNLLEFSDDDCQRIVVGKKMTCLLLEKIMHIRTLFNRIY